MEINFLSCLTIFLASILSAMGLGGGSLLMLCFVFFFDLPQKDAQMLNLLLFLPSTAIALLFHRKNHLLRQDLLRTNLPAGMIGAILGSFLGLWINSRLLRKIFGIFLLLMAVQELKNLLKKTPPSKA